jgi:hypothetical protein
MQIGTTYATDPTLPKPDPDPENPPIGPGPDSPWPPIDDPVNPGYEPLPM